MSVASAVPTLEHSLNDWLAWLETIHPVAIDMGLERVAAVADQLGLRPVTKPLILVGGTNGKGSTVAMLSAIYSAAGYKVGAYTSPHIEHFCERICYNGEPVDSQLVVDALAFVEHGRSPSTLTYFEYTTLAAMRVFNKLECDVLLFEVGLGGRLDATNIWDADCSIITSIALDHEDYLGSDVSVIATEKAAIGRTGKPFVLGETQPPESLGRYVTTHQLHLIDVGSVPLESLPETSMKGGFQRRNAACAAAAVAHLQELVPVLPSVIVKALKSVSVPGRFERLKVGGADFVFDVAHNPAGATALVQAWRSVYGEQRCQLLFASLCDKDIAGVVDSLAAIVDSWHVLALETARAAPTQELSRVIKTCDNNAIVIEHRNVNQAVQRLLADAVLTGNPVLVAGSFYTIAAAKSELSGSSSLG